MDDVVGSSPGGRPHDFMRYYPRLAVQFNLITMTDSQQTARIAFVTGSAMPAPDTETSQLIDTLTGMGIGSTLLPWQAACDWSAFELIVLRTPWDYIHQVDAFLAWAERCARQSALLNPYSVIRWNLHKRYLLDLQRRSVPIVPTTLLRAGDAADDADLRRYGMSVAKPAVGVGAIGAYKGDSADAGFADHVNALLTRGDVLLQPFVTSIAERGEVSLIYFNGAYSHAIRKIPARGDYRVHETHGGATQAHQPSAAELAVADAALAASPAPTMYARVDLVEIDGAPVIMELELIEPELFFRFAPESVATYAGHLQHALKSNAAY